MRVNTKRGRTVQKEGEKRGVGRPRKTKNVTPKGGEEADGDAPPPPPGRVTIKQFKEEKKAHGRLCGDMSKYLVHKASIISTKHELKCKWCGKNCYTKCGICGIPCHDGPKKGVFKGYQCFTELHNDVRLGLAITDCALVNKSKDTWTEPTEEEKEANSRHINNIQRKLPYRLRGRVPTVEDSL
jgi:hypothetical protein